MDLALDGRVVTGASRGLVRANLEGPMALTQAVIPAMKAGRWERILHVSSTVAIDGTPGAGWYSAVKAALHGLTRTLAKELPSSDVFVNAILPAASAHMFLTPADIAPAGVFLCSPMNRAITGQLIAVTRGLPTPGNVIRPPTRT